MINTIQKWISEFLALSLGIRLTVGVILGAIGSSSIIAFLSEYAGVSYALAQGVRLPTEGVPYLRYAAAGLSFTLFLLAFGIFFGIYGLLRFLHIAATSYAIDPATKEKGRAQKPSATFLGENVAWEKSTVN
jgi:hypothetical protein